MDAGRAGRHPGATAVGRCRTTAPRSPTLDRARRGAAGRVRRATSQPSRPAAAARGSSPRRPPRCAGAPGLRWIGDDRRRRGRADGGPGRPAAGGGRRPRGGPSAAAIFKIERGAPARGSRTCGCSPARCTSRDASRRAGGPGHRRSACCERRRVGVAPERSRRARSRKLWGLAHVRVGDTIGERADRRGSPPLRAADAGGARGHRTAPERRRRAARRAGPARRAGSADQRAGRREPGDGRLALRRGAEGGHPGDARRGLRHRGRASRRRRRCASSVRPASATAVEVLNTPANPFHATIGLRIEPGAAGVGHRVPHASVDCRLVPLYVYRTLDAFTRRDGASTCVTPGARACSAGR